MGDPYIGKEVVGERVRWRFILSIKKGIGNWIPNGISVWSKWSMASSLSFLSPGFWQYLVAKKQWRNEIESRLHLGVTGLLYFFVQRNRISLMLNTINYRKLIFYNVLLKLSLSPFI